MPRELNRVKSDVPLRRMWVTTVTVAGVLFIVFLIVLFLYNMIRLPSH